MRKKISLISVLLSVLLFFVSCGGDFSERTFYTANVVAFSFSSHDTCPDIEDYVFNINQLPDTGLIYNLDSLPYGRKVDRLHPTIKFQSSNGDCFLNDSLWEDNKEDSLDFTAPVYLRNTSQDGLLTRLYRINVNVHQVNPDSMIMQHKSVAFPVDAGENKIVSISDGILRCYFALPSGGISAYSSVDGGATWALETVAGILEPVKVSSLCTFKTMYYLTALSGQLYSSVDGLSWNATGDGTKIRVLYGEIKDKYFKTNPATCLIGLAENASGEICFAKTADGIHWKDSIGEEVPDDFPVSDYAVVKGTTVTDVEFYTVATGLNGSGTFCSGVWSTENGKNWVSIDDKINSERALVKRKGAVLFYYDSHLVCFGGIDEEGHYTNDLHVSKNNGKDWIDAPDDWAFARLTGGLAYPSVCVERVEDEDNDKDREFVWIFGGKKDTGAAGSDVWKCFLYKMIFKRR